MGQSLGGGSSGDGHGNITDAFNTFLNGFTQYASGGQVGFNDKSFSTKAGVLNPVTSKVVNESVSGLKDVTGAKAAEEATALAKQQFEEQKVASAKQRQDNQAQNLNIQIAASNNAQAIRNTAQAKTNPTSKLGADEKVFLGI